MSDTYLTDKLSMCLQECLAVAEEGKIVSLKNILNDTIRAIDSPLQLAIIGQISSSKSTLVNALLGAEIVEMGWKETTYNVSWIKYGSSDSDIKVVYKDGNTKMIKRAEWESWSNQSASQLKGEVLYLEVTYPHETLKRINIIDTPGLDSTKGTDSKNTIDFLKKVKPDAVLLIFTQAIAESAMNVLKEYQNAGGRDSFRLSPLNAIGLYAKIDSIWLSDNTLIPIEKANEVINSNIYKKFPEVKRSLHTIFPICAIAGLAAKTISDSDFQTIRKFTSIPEDKLNKLLSSAARFEEDDISEYTEVSCEIRKNLKKKYELYCIYSIIKYIAQNPDCTVAMLRNHLMQISGLRKVENRLLMHFGDRAVLIKMQNIAIQIVRECEHIRQSVAMKQYADDIESILLRALHNIKEFRELDYLAQIYEGDTSPLDSDALEEYKTLCGEKGYSMQQRLQLSDGVDCQTMIEKAQQRVYDANSKAYIYHLLSDSANEELYMNLCDSYTILIQRITEMQQRKQRAEQDLNIVQSFFYGD